MVKKVISIIGIILVSCILLYILGFVFYFGFDAAPDELTLPDFIEALNDFSDKVKKAEEEISLKYNNERTEAQVCYELATGIAPSDDDKMPSGEKLNYSFLDEDEVCYEIMDYSLIDGYSEKTAFHGNSNGVEKHYISSKGRVFTVPGFPNQLGDYRDIIWYVNGTDTYILNDKNEYELKVGRYNISYNAYTSSLTEEERFEIGSYYDDMPIRFFEDSTFEISFPEDIVISGEYKIAENKVICTCKTFGFLLGEIDEYYNVKNEDFEYIFEFVDENSIKVVEINSPDYTHGPFVDEDVSVGNIYTYEEN